MFVTGGTNFMVFSFEGSPKSWQNGSQLPTMVPPSSAFGSVSGSGPGSVGSSGGPGGSDDDDDDSGDSSNDVSPTGNVQCFSCYKKSVQTVKRE